MLTEKEIMKLQNGSDVRGIAVDGVFGEATVSALRNFQAVEGLTEDGVCGNETFQRLNNPTNSSGIIPEVSGWAELGDVIKPGMRGEGVADVQNK